MDVVIKKSKINDNWLLFVLASCLLLLYTISRIISLSRRIRDLEARPPVDEIILRGLIRQEVQAHAEKLDAIIEEKFENMELKVDNVEVKMQHEDQPQKTIVQLMPSVEIAKEILLEDTTNVNVANSTKKRSNTKPPAKKKSSKVPKNVDVLDLSHLEEIEVNIQENM